MKTLRVTVHTTKMVEPDSFTISGNIETAMKNVLKEPCDPGNLLFCDTDERLIVYNWNHVISVRIWEVPDHATKKEGTDNAGKDA